jgi:GNAT superfamily N-acetyltransferase
VGSADAPRLAGTADARAVAELLHRFNSEYDTPTPGVGVLAGRLRRLLAGPETIALLTGEPPVGVALVTLRPNVWHDGSVALLDELYVEASRRGQGIGTALLRATEMACRERGAAVLEINVDGEDRDARRFYERHGYVNHDPGQTEPAIYYFRELRS